MSSSGWIEVAKTTNACGAFKLLFFFFFSKSNPFSFPFTIFSLTKKGCDATLFAGRPAALKSHLRPLQRLELNLNLANPPSACRLLPPGPERHVELGQLQDHPDLGSPTVERLHVHCGVLLVSKKKKPCRSSLSLKAALEFRCVLLGPASTEAERL